MGNRRRSKLDAEAARQLGQFLLREGGKVRQARRRRRWTQRRLGELTGVSQSSVSRIERGEGGALSLLVRQKAALVLGLPFTVELGRDARQEPADAGHLAVQELALRIGRAAGYRRTYEMPTKPADPSLSTDVGLIDDANRRLLLVECVNTFGNINASIRSSDRKRAEAGALAISIGHGAPYAVFSCWIVRATRRNRQPLAQYPELFAARFRGSSRRWIGALTTGSEPPAEAGLVWRERRRHARDRVA